MRCAQSACALKKPHDSAFTSEDIPKILELKPDLVLTFSDLQAEIAAALLREGVAVMGYNQRDIAGFLAMIRHLGAMVGQGRRAARLADHYEQRLARVVVKAEGKPRPRVYLEEWDTPMISGIGCVSELIDIAGGQEVFPDLARQDKARVLDGILSRRSRTGGFTKSSRL